MTRRRRPRNAAESYRNTRRSMGDGTMSGRSRIATPHDTTKLRRATSIVPSGHEPIGETVTVESVARDGDDLVWTRLAGGPVPAGRPQTFPTTALVTRTGGYYVLHLEKLDLVSRGGATVTVTTSSGLVRVAAEPSFGRHLRGAEVPLGVLPRGTTVTVACDQPIVLAVATLEHKDIGALVVNDPPPEAPQDNLYVWYRADAIEGFANGTDLTLWVDSGPNGLDLQHLDDGLGNIVTGGMWPKYRVGQQNGLPLVDFGPSSERRSIAASYGAASLGTADNHTAYILARFDALPDRTTWVVGRRRTGDAGQSSAGLFTNGSNVGSPLATEQAATGWNIWTVIREDATSEARRVYRNGSLLASGTVSSVGGSWSTTRLGDGTNIDNNAMAGVIAEVIGYEAIHSPAEIAEVLGYLADKWDV